MVETPARKKNSHLGILQWYVLWRKESNGEFGLGEKRT